MTSSAINLRNAIKEQQAANDQRHGKNNPSIKAGSIGKAYVAVGGNPARATLAAGSKGEVEVVNVARPASAHYVEKLGGAGGGLNLTMQQLINLINSTVSDFQDGLDSDSSSDTHNNPTTLQISVEPAYEISAEGMAGDDFTTHSLSYTLYNPNASAVDWSVTKLRPWVTLSATSGTLDGRRTTTVTVSINANASTLTAGEYGDTITFYGGARSAAIRFVTLKVNNVLLVTPGDNLVASGAVGDDFTGYSQTYTLTNPNTVAVNWTVTKTQTWVDVDVASGTLDGGDSTTVTVSFGSGASALTAGDYRDTVLFNAEVA